MLMVYYKKNMDQKCVNYKNMSTSEFKRFKKAIQNRKIIAFIVGIEPSFLS